MIGGVSSGLGTGWYNLAAMNDFKLSQALANRGTSVSAISAINKTTTGLGTDSTKFLKEYQGHLTELEQLSKELSNNVTGSATNALGVSSSNGSVLSASAKYTMTTPASYTVDVKQLATGQVNISDAVAGNSTPTASGSFVLETQAGKFGFEIDSSEATSNREMLGAVAKEINRLKTGVTAQVVEDGGKVSLALSGTQVGENSGFSVSGDFAEKIGLTSVVQQAQDAVYTVDKQGDALGAMTYTSSSNTVSLGGYQIEATLKQTGSAQVTVGTDANRMADSIQKLVDKYNETTSFLDKNSDRGIGVLEQLKRMTSLPTSESSMKMIGITLKKDGSFAFDRSTFLSAMNRNPTLTREVVGGNFGFAQGVQKDAKAGLNTPSANLVSTGLGSWQAGSMNAITAQQQSTIKMLSTYSRSGAYNMMNYYAVGALMNFNV